MELRWLFECRRRRRHRLPVLDDELGDDRLDKRRLPCSRLVFRRPLRDDGDAAGFSGTRCEQCVHAPYDDRDAGFHAVDLGRPPDESESIRVFVVDDGVHLRLGGGHCQVYWLQHLRGELVRLRFVGSRECAGLRGNGDAERGCQVHPVRHVDGRLSERPLPRRLRADIRVRRNLQRPVEHAASRRHAGSLDHHVRDVREYECRHRLQLLRVGQRV